MTETKFKKGLVIGKFMPPHKGHEYLIRFAKQWCDELIVVVDCLEKQTISPTLRKQWIEEEIPGITVIALDKFMPQDPSETPDFWTIWRDALIQSCNGQPDALFASETYGTQLSNVLNCQFIECDISRTVVDISATKIRSNTFQYWDYLMNSAKGYFLKKVCLIGPESTGKTTLCEKLSHQYNTTVVTEYAERLIKSQNGKFFKDDVLKVAHAQIRSEKALENMTNKIMFCDSDVITTMVWSDTLFGEHPKELDEIAATQKYDLTFLLYPDTPWVHDKHRECLNNPDKQDVRLLFFNQMETYLKKFNRKYLVLKGNYEVKTNQSIDIINNLFFN